MGCLYINWCLSLWSVKRLVPRQSTSSCPTASQKAGLWSFDSAGLHKSWPKTDGPVTTSPYHPTNIYIYILVGWYGVGCHLNHQHLLTSMIIDMCVYCLQMSTVFQFHPVILRPWSMASWAPAPHFLFLRHAHVLVNPRQSDEFELGSSGCFEVGLNETLQEEKIGQAKTQSARANVTRIPVHCILYILYIYMCVHVSVRKQKKEMLRVNSWF